MPTSLYNLQLDELSAASNPASWGFDLEQNSVLTVNRNGSVRVIPLDDVSTILDYPAGTCYAARCDQDCFIIDLIIQGQPIRWNYQSVLSMVGLTAREMSFINRNVIIGEDEYNKLINGDFRKETSIIYIHL